MKKGKRTYGIVIPVGNNSRYLGDVLFHLNKLTVKADQIVIVNDRIQDRTLEPLSVLEQEYQLVSTDLNNNRYGVSAARNIGVENCTCDIIVFVDSDVLLTPNYLEQLEKQYDKDWDKVDGIMGLSSEYCPFDNFNSQYKNLWMRFTYLRMKGIVGSITTSSLAIKKDVFEKSGGFDEFRRRDVEDAVFGDQLKKQGFNIVVNKNLDYIHKKYYNFGSLFKIDIFRSRKLTEFTLPITFSSEKNPESSIPFGYFLAIPLTYLAILSLPLFLINPFLILISPGLLLLATFLSLDFIIYTAKVKTINFALRAILKQFFVFFASGLGILKGILNLLFLSFRLKKKSSSLSCT